MGGLLFAGISLQLDHNDTCAQHVCIFPAIMSRISPLRSPTRPPNPSTCRKTLPITRSPFQTTPDSLMPSCLERDMAHTLAATAYPIGEPPPPLPTPYTPCSQPPNRPGNAITQPASPARGSTAAHQVLLLLHHIVGAGRWGPHLFACLHYLIY